MTEALDELKDSSILEFRPLYFSHDVFSCFFRVTKNKIKTNYLVLLLTKSLQVLPARRLESRRSLFVRNNENFLYYGVRVEQGENDYHYVLWGLDLKTQRWSTERPVLRDFYGHDFGETVSFEIFDDYFYGITSEGPLLGESNTFYTSFHFIIGQHARIEYLDRRLAWQRHANQGLIDNRWSQIELAKDEASGRIFVYETRMEWESSRRICYRKELRFPARGERAYYIQPQTSPRSG